MGRYLCPVCSSKTGVIETRVSDTRLRRRRMCLNGHRFNTVELPFDLPQKLTDLITWLTRQGLDEDIASYAKERLHNAFTGIDPDD